jgi:hypothetical protein
VSFKAIASVPSFELWLLLHYEEVQSPLHRVEAMQRLKQHFPDYDKGMKGAYAATKDRLTDTIKRTESLSARSSADSAPEPYTAVVDLVMLLISLRNE